MTGLLVGSAAGTISTSEKEVDRSDLEGAVFFIGQDLSVGGFEPGERVALRQGDREDSTLVEFIRADEDGTLDFSTDDLDGHHVLRAEDGTMYGPFEVTEQTVSFAFEDETINAGETTKLEFVDDNRLATVDLLVSTDGALTADELASVFDGATVEDDETVRINDVSQGDTILAEFTSVSAGEYSFTVAVADTDASDTVDISVGEPIEEQTSFDADEYTGVEGDVVEFAVEHQATDESWVELHEVDGNYDLTFEIVDPERDTVRIRFNTWYASDDPADFDEALSSPDADLEVVDASAAFDTDAGERLLHAPIELETGPDTTDRGSPTDAAVLSLEARETEDITTYVAPSDRVDSDDKLRDITDISTERETLATEDILVVAVETTGVFGYIEDEIQAGSDVGIDVTLTQTDRPRYGAPFEQSLLTQDTDATIRTDPSNETLYLIVNEADLDGTEPGMTLEASFEISEDNPYTVAEKVTTDFEVIERSLALVGPTDQMGRLEIPATDESPIRAETTVAPGTRLQYSIRLPFSRHTMTAPVEGNAATAFIDISDYNEGTEIESITARDPVTGQEVSETGIVVDEQAAAIQVEATAPENANVDEAASLNVSVTNTGSETGVANLEVVIDDAVVDTRTFTLGPSDKWSKSYPLETSEPGERTWAIRSPAEKNGSVTIATSNAEDADNGNGDGSFGFGVAVALVALLSAAMLALRRQN